MKSKKHPTTDTTSTPPGGRRIRVRAEHRDPPDLDRFVAVLVTLALRRMEEEAAKSEEAAGD